ncbi:MAG TPA: DUF1844 domain-containing protein [Halothiobacillaceae bacterium]|nr:DUF1844 domain-containing protein [Halothiobacillaceae bacterium]
MAEQEPEKKIIVDEDWKTQAQREKEALETEQQTGPDEQDQRGELPPANLTALISMFATQAMFGLGLIHEEGSQPPPPDPVMARFNIDMLQTLEDKTQGNLTEEEAQMLQTTLAQLRMVFVQVFG